MISVCFNFFNAFSFGFDPKPQVWRGLAVWNCGIWFLQNFYSHSPQAGVEDRGFCGVVDSVKMVGRDSSTTFLS